MAQIRRIGLTYYVRYTVPKDRWQEAGRREVVRTLQTRDLKEARKRLGPALVAIRRDLDEVLAGKGAPPMSGDWTPSWASPTGSVDAALKARSEIEHASPEPIRRVMGASWQRCRVHWMPVICCAWSNWN